MSIPVLQVPCLSNTKVVGDVTIDPTAIIAPGVILNATPGSRIVIKSGACLGMGTIITAIGGDVVVESNAILGAGSLIVGACVIGCLLYTS
ncbi:MAG: transferase, partial [Geminocystis sp.]|nr:transferase [Geminocystis sp.]